MVRYFLSDVLYWLNRMRERGIVDPDVVKAKDWRHMLQGVFLSVKPTEEKVRCSR